MLGWKPNDLLEIDGALGEARRGSSGLLMVEGGPGLGKTSLLREIASRAADFAVVAVEGSVSDLEPLSLVKRIGVELPTQASPLAAGLALSARLGLVARRTPVLLMVDDAQWADRESVHAIVRMLEGAERDRLLVVVATHPLTGGHHEELQEYIDLGRPRRIVLEGLDRTAAKEIAGAIGLLDDDTVERVWRMTEGNPLYFTSVLRDQDPVELGRLDFLPAPQRFAASVLRRLRGLGEPAVELGFAAAVLGPNWHAVAKVSALAGVAEPTRPTESLLNAGLIEHRLSADPGGSIRFVHRLVCAAIYQNIDLDRRRKLHQAAAATSDDQEVELEHRVAAADVFDEELASELACAADRNHAAGAFRRAARQYRRASRLTADQGARQDRHLDALLEQVFAGDAAGLTEELARLTDAGDDRVAVLKAAHASIQNRWSDVLRHLEPVIVAPVEATDPLVRYRAEVLAAWAGIGVGVPTERIATGLGHARATGADDPGLLGFRMFAEGQLCGRREGAAGLRAATGWLPRSPAEVPLEASYVLLLRGMNRLADGDGPGAQADLTEVEHRFRSGVVDIADGVAHAGLGVAHWYQGNWRLAEVKFRTAQALQRRIVNPMNAAMISLGPTRAGDFAGADALLADARDRLIRQPWAEAFRVFVSALSVRLHAEGNAAAQARALGALEADFGPELLAPAEPMMPFWWIQRALLSVWAKRRDEAEEILERLRRDPGILTWVEGGALWLQGLLAEQQGQAGRARRFFDDALNGGIKGMPLLRAHALADRARIDHDPDALARATDEYRALGQVVYADRLRTAASRPAGPPTKSAHTVVLNSLSGREKDVLALVTAGLSYAQIAQDLFISTRTVSFHLTNIYAKTGVSGRHALTALVRSSRHHP